MLAKPRPRRPSHATVVAYLALFVALGGTGAYAANTVFSSDIVDGEVKTPDLESGAVNGAKVEDNSLSGADVVGRPGTIGTPAVNGSLTTDDIAGQQANAANGTPFIDGTLTQWDIKNGTVTGADVQESSLGKVPDADKLDGLDFTQLSPVSGDGRTADLALDDFNTTVLAASLTTARSGALLVSAAVNVRATDVWTPGPGGSPGVNVICRFRFDGGPTESVHYRTTLDVAGQQDTLPVVWARAVGPGAHTVELVCGVGLGGAATVDNAGMIVSGHV